MKKRISALYSLFCVGVIAVVIATILIVSGIKNKNDNEATNDMTISNGVFSASGIELVVNNGQDVSVPTGCTLEFLDSFVTTKPYKYAKELKYYYNDEELTDRAIRFTQAGTYPIKLVLGDGSIASFNVNVIEDTEPLIKQTKSIIRTNQTMRLSDMFTIPQGEYDVNVVGAIDYIDGVMYPNAVGISNVVFSTTIGKMRVSYEFSIEVTDEQQFDLVIENLEDVVTMNLNSKTKLNIQYNIEPQMEYENVIVLVTIDGVDIDSTRIRVAPPLVTIDFVDLLDTDIDSVVVTLTLENDSRISDSVRVNFLK